MIQKNRRKDKGSAIVWFLAFLILIALWAAYRVGKLHFDHAQIEERVLAIGGQVMSSDRHDPHALVQTLFSKYQVELKREEYEIEFSEDGKMVSFYIPYSRIAEFYVMQYRLYFVVDVKYQFNEGNIIGRTKKKIEGDLQKGSDRYEP